MRADRHLATGALALLLVLLPAAVPVTAAQTQQGGDESPAQAAPDRPEHRFRPLPEDTFKPSEEISEDYPVPFPVDI